MSQITIQEVNTEFVKKGRTGYTKATVVYTDEKGENRTKPLMSFSNPAVFEALKDATQGDKFEIKVVKEGEYWNWSAASRVDKDATPSAKAPNGGKVVGSNYETADERKVKQLYIIKQSSIANAIEFVNGKTDKDDYDTEAVLNIAQTFVDFVYGVDENLGTVDTAD